MESIIAALGGVVFLFAALVIASVVFWIVMLVDAVQRYSQDSDNRLLWVLIIILGGLLGAIIYFFVGRKKTLNVEENSK